MSSDCSTKAISTQHNAATFCLRLRNRLAGRMSVTSQSLDNPMELRQVALQVPSLELRAVALKTNRTLLRNGVLLPAHTSSASLCLPAPVSQALQSLPRTVPVERILRFAAALRAASRRRQRREAKAGMAGWRFLWMRRQRA